MCKVPSMKEASNILSEVLSERQASNSSYSLRAFARDIGLSPQQLSNVMNGHRGLSIPVAERIAKELNLDSHQKEFFIQSLKAKFSISKNQRIVAQAKLSELQTSGGSKSLQLDLFKTISNWYHFALVELIKISKGRKNTIEWFSAKLGIPENEVNLALGRLERLELISKTSQGWKVNQDTVVSDQGIPTEAVKNFHRQLLEKSIQALAFQNGDERYGSSSTMPVKVKNVNRAKKLIQKFRVDFAKEISDHEGGEEIYGLSLQFYRLTNKT